jgi:hypothetical protein
LLVAGLALTTISDQAIFAPNAAQGAVADQTLIATGSTWKYHAQGVDLGTSWRTVDYVDSGWPSGRAQLGYGDGDESTTLSFGSNSNNRYPTYYFRQTFNVASSGASLTLRYLRDDGCVIYLNGAEIVRSNMPGGSITYTTLATSAIGGADESSWLQTSINPALLHTGTNVIAVELHQSAVNSTDISFDLELLSTPPQTPTPSVTLLSPADKGLTNITAVTFAASASDASGLQSATLYLGSNLRTVTFSGTQQIQDTQISADQASTNFGNATNINVDGQTPHAHGLMKFPSIIGNGTGQVPAAANISSATLQINCTNFGNPLKIYRLTQDWVEGQANWNQRSSGVSWSSPGADGTGSRTAVALDGPCPAVGLRSIDLTPIVQEWSSGAANYGILLADSGIDGIDFGSSESATSPVLTVQYQASRQAVETKSLSGNNQTVSFNVNLPSVQTYFWNVLVTNTSGGQSWASADYQLTVDFNAPDPPVLVSPDDGSSGVSTSPSLEVRVSDPNGGPLDVTFFGRTLPAAEEFTFVVLPDTQHYSEAFPEIYTAQTQWIVNNKAARNIVFVTHLGDLVEHASVPLEWQRAKASMSLLDGVVPYGMGPGNHDQPTDLYNQYFPFRDYEGLSWYGGHLGNKNDNNFQRISAGGLNFLFIHLEFCPPPSVITWADSVLKDHPNHKAIITTHGYLGANAERSVHGCTNTQPLWDGLAVQNQNVHFMLSGHVHAEARRTDTLNGRPVHQILSDYQERANGGEGWLRIMRFVPAENKIYVQTYSPWLNRFETDADSQFTLDFPMGGFSTLGTRSAESDSTAFLTWRDLLPLREYEWKVTGRDNTGRSQTGPVWRFTTGTPVPNELPQAESQSVTTNEDSPLGIALSATDPEGVPLSFAVVSGPAQGTLTGSAPNLTYQPGLNFNGSDSFTFKANDGQADSNVATVTVTVIAANDAPTAANDGYGLAQDNSLAVAAPGVLANDGDIDGGALTAVLLSSPANGIVTISADGSFNYTPNAGFSGSDSFTYTANDGATNSNPATVNLTVAPASGAVILSANFDTGSDGFSYLDNAFRSTTQSSYANGTRLASGGFSGGALSVTLGGVNNNTITGMSGGWQRTFTLTQSTPVVISFRYNLTQSPEYESDEYSQALISVNGVLYGAAPSDFVAQVSGNGSGGSPITTNWQLYQIHLGTLAAGTHTLRLGGFNSRKNASNESTTVLIDELLLAIGPEPVLEAHFTATEDGFGYFDDLFRSTSQPSYASGNRVTSGGVSGGALRVLLGGVNSSTVTGMSGGWRRTFSLASATQVVLRFSYNLTQSPEYESDENSQMLVNIDGVLYGEPPNDYLARVVGNGSGGGNITTGWRSSQITLNLPAGNHTLSIGAFNSKKNASNESTTALVDDVILVQAQ